MARKTKLDLFTESCWEKHQELLADPKFEDIRQRAADVVNRYKQVALSPERLAAYGMSDLAQWCDYRVVFGRLNKKDEDWIDDYIRYADCATFCNDKNLLKTMTRSYRYNDTGSRQWGDWHSGVVFVGSREFNYLGNALYEYSDLLDSENANVVVGMSMLAGGYTLGNHGVVTVYMVVKNLKMLPKMARFFQVDFNNWLNPQEKINEWSIGIEAGYYSNSFRNAKVSTQDKQAQKATSLLEQSLIDWIRSGNNG